MLKKTGIRFFCGNFYLMTLIFFAGLTVKAYDLKIPLSKVVIVLPEKADGAKKFAADELKKHLELISGEKIKIINSANIPADTFPLYVGTVFSGDKKALAKEEARYKITDKAVYIYGEDKISKSAKTPIEEALEEKYNRTGTLFAVYFFLENEFGVSWIEPGDKGIVFKPSKELVLSEKNFSWIPPLAQRHFRPVLLHKNIKAANSVLPEKMQLSEKEAMENELEEKTWLRRMKMGRNIILSYGHRFTEWWNKYGKTHPEYFALTEKGKREPMGAPDRIKMCVSNPALHKAIVNEWYEKYKKDPENSSKVINVCENDSRGYCQCPECVKLDVKKEGEAFDAHLSDRYIWFANTILKEARKLVPDAKVIMYAYSDYKLVPRREKVESGVILGMVPSLLMPIDDLDKYYADWKAAGANEFFLRPNDMHIDTGLPSGFEKKMFENYKVAAKYGIFGTDYDSLHGFWPTSGIADYTLARAQSFPKEPFEKWENEYYSAFGAAKDDVKEYFHYWRKVWDERFYPQREEIGKAGRYGNFRRGLMWKLSEYYKKEDFEKTKAILTRAMDKVPSVPDRERLKSLMLGLEQAELTFDAICAYNGNGSKDPQEKFKAIQKLLNFRIENKDKLNINWSNYFALEKQFGDVSGLIWLQSFGEKLTPLRQMPLPWYFKTDENDIGLKEAWEKTKWSDIAGKWKRIMTNKSWKAQGAISEELKKQLETYSGIGWYAINLNVDESLRNKKVYLTFGAVDKSCWVYINGKEVGKHVYTLPDDWKLPFSIRIDEAFSADKNQTIIVRVEPGGIGGIWKAVWLSLGK